MYSLFRKQPRPESIAGSLAISPESAPPVIHVFRLNQGTISEVDVDTLTAAAGLSTKDGDVLWIDVHGLGDEAGLRDLARAFDIPDLALADVVNVPQRDKVQMLPEQIFVIGHEVWRETDSTLFTDQISLFLGDQLVISLHDGDSDSFDPVRQRLQHARSRIVHQGADYLLYALLDTLIDSYYPLLDAYADEIDELQEEIFEQPTSEHQERLLVYRRQLMEIRRAIWPLRELVNTLIRNDTDVMMPETLSHFRDCFDHAAVLVEMVDSLRDTVSGLNDAYLALVSNRMNEVMKLLTLISTIFIPLAFLAGVFGMNFEREGRPLNMPELGAPFGYLIFWGICLMTAGGMIWYFKRKRWI